MLSQSFQLADARLLDYLAGKLMLTLAIRKSCCCVWLCWSIGGYSSLQPAAADLPNAEDQISGSTATVVLIRRDKIVVANVGDSRAVLSRRGQPVDLSTEHR